MKSFHFLLCFTVMFVAGCQVSVNQRANVSPKESGTRYRVGTRDSKSWDHDFDPMINKDREGSDYSTTVRIMRDEFKAYLDSYRPSFYRRSKVYSSNSVSVPKPPFPSFVYTSFAPIYSHPLTGDDVVTTKEPTEMNSVRRETRRYFEIGILGERAILYDKSESKMIEVPVQSIDNPRLFQYIDNSEMFYVKELVRVTAQRRLEITHGKPTFILTIYLENEQKLVDVSVKFIGRHCVVVSKVPASIKNIVPGQIHAVSRVSFHKFKNLVKSHEAKLWFSKGYRQVYQLCETEMLSNALKLN